MPPRTLYFICSGLLNLSLLGRSLRDVIQSKMCSLDVYRLINDNTTVKRQYFYYNKFLQTTLATAIWKKSFIISTYLAGDSHVQSSYVPGSFPCFSGRNSPSDGLQNRVILRIENSKLKTVIRTCGKIILQLPKQTRIADLMMYWGPFWIGGKIYFFQWLWPDLLLFKCDRW